MNVALRTYRLAVSILVVVLSWPALSLAQLQAASAQQERLYGLTIDAIEILSPNPEDARSLLEMSGLQVGNALESAEIRRAIKILYQQGRYENVYVFGRRVGNVVELKLKLLARNFLQEVSSYGANRLSESGILEAAGLKIGDPIDLDTLPGHRKRLAAHYFALGYRSAAIGMAIQAQNSLGASRLILRVDEGPASRLRKLTLKGDLRLPVWKIKALLDVEPGTIIETAFLKKGIERIRGFYHRRGFLRVEIETPELDGHIDPVSGWVDLKLTIRAGPKVSIHFAGNRSVPFHELQDATAELRHDLAKEGVLADAAESLFSLYERRGYWKAKIRPVVRTRPDGRQMVITFLIDEGPKGRVTKISFPGNKALDEDLLRAKVYSVVRQYLGLDATTSKPDSEIIDQVIGQGSVSSSRAMQRPYPADPNAKTLYVARAYRAVADSLENLFRAQGYQTVEITRPKIEEIKNGTELQISFLVNQGIAWEIAALTFVGNENIKSSSLFDIAGLEPGEPLSFYRIDAASRALRSYYQDRGFYYVKLEEKLRSILPRGQTNWARSVQSSSVASTDLREVCARAHQAKKPSCEIELVLRLDEGPLVRTNRIVVRGNETTRRALIDEEITLLEGDLLRAGELEQTQKNLSRLGVFQRVSVRPIEAERLESKKDVLVELVERKHSSFELGTGLSTEEGVRAYLSYGHNNLLGTALRFQTNAKLNAQVFFGLFNDAVAKFIEQDPIEYQLAMGMQYPRIIGLPRGIGMGLDAILLRDNDPAFRAQSRQITYTADYKGLGRALGRRPFALQLQAGFDQSSIECNEELISLGLCGAQATDVQRRVTQDTDYLTLLPRLSIDFRDNRLEPRIGVYLELLPEFLWGLNEESLNHFNLKTKFNAYLPLGKNLTFATSLLFWRIFRMPDEDGDVICQKRLDEFQGNGRATASVLNCIPVNRRLFAGGRSTIRGFQEQTLFPADQMAFDEEVSPGGMLMAAVKTELRFSISDGLAGTVFFDFGDLFSSPESFSVQAISQHSFGLGLRYTTPIGPLLLDGAFRIENGAPQFIPHFAAVGSF